MKAILQRVSRASVTIDGEMVGQIGQGLLVLLGVAKDDSADDMKWLVDKFCNLRIFANQDGKFDKSLLDIQGELLIVSQFTLFADCRKGRRPNFDAAAPPQKAEQLYNQAVDYCRSKGVRTETGRFAAMMDVELVNDGPVTIELNSKTI
ncbi:MAG: D-aminoacyl-tRNA deacylase [Candidatus Hinthialibacter antarcticus]|nr:D-aminoacyl-tRNA deacylase [Candidatus Hinthialibacter antarcticus]